MSLQCDLSLENLVGAILAEYAHSSVVGSLAHPELSLRNDLSIESLALVSVVLKLGDELGVDVVDSGFELHAIQTVGDLLQLGRNLKASKTRASIH